MIRLLATDLDGTLIGNGEQDADYDAFRDLVGAVRRRGGEWAIITGRHLGAMQNVLVEFYYRRLVPNYVIVEDARMYRVHLPLRFWPFWWWNLRVDARRFALNLRHRGFLKRLSQELTQLVPDGEDRSRPGIDIWIHCPDEEQADAAERLVRERTLAVSEYLLFRWGQELCLTPAPGTKADALGRLADRKRLHPAEIFAVGDGSNDLSMLESPRVGWAACVANASDGLRNTVEMRGGYVAKQSGLRGVLEALSETGEPELCAP